MSTHTDTGKVRGHNEDQFLVSDLSQAESRRVEGTHELELGPKGCVLAVADGMGGALGGEVASEMAVNVIQGHLLEGWTADSQSDVDVLRTYSREAVEEANARIHDRAEADPDLAGMGSTATVVCALGNQLVVNQVGDSRAYLVRDGSLRMLTRDQSLAQKLVDLGRITEHEAEHMTNRNVILQALGPSSDLDVVQSEETVEDGDLLLICSDGLTTVVTDTEIAEIAGSDGALEKMGEELIRTANRKGGPDNITVVLARFALSGD